MERQKIGNYLVREPIKVESGWGDLFIGQNPHVENDVVVIKILKKHLCESAEALGRFQTEAECQAWLSRAGRLHENVLPYVTFGKTSLPGNRPYIITPYIAGGSLRSMLQDRKSVV